MFLRTACKSPCNEKLKYVCIYPTPPHKQDGTQDQFLSGFEFRVFLLLDWLPD